MLWKRYAYLRDAVFCVEIEVACSLRVPYYLYSTLLVALREAGAALAACQGVASGQRCCCAVGAYTKCSAVALFTCM